MCVCVNLLYALCRQKQITVHNDRCEANVKLGRVAAKEHPDAAARHPTIRPPHRSRTFELKPIFNPLLRLGKIWGGNQVEPGSFM